VHAQRCLLLCKIATALWHRQAPNYTIVRTPRGGSGAEAAAGRASLQPCQRD